MDRAFHTFGLVVETGVPETESDSFETGLPDRPEFMCLGKSELR